MVSGCATSDAGAAQGRMPQRTEALQRLDRLSTQEFRAHTVIASDPDTVHRLLRDTEEVQWLAAHPGQSVPEILERIRRGYKPSDPVEMIAYYEELLPYFVVLEQAGDPRAVPVLLEYVEQLPHSERRGIGSPWHPFLYAMLALDKLCDLGLRQPGDLYLPRATELFLRRHEIADQVRQKLEQRAGP